MADPNSPTGSSERGSAPANIVAPLRAFVDEELRGVYTVTFVIVESVDESRRRATVTAKSDRDVVVDNVPIASPFATDGGGLIAPVSRNDEGLLLHTKEPLTKRIRRGGEEQPDGERRFTLESGVLLPMVWLDDDDVPDHEKGEFQLALPGDGSALRLFPDGRVRVEHASGNVIAMDADGGVTIGDPANASQVLTEDAVLKDADGNPVDIVDPGASDLDAS
jgi:hypothetical protein